MLYIANAEGRIVRAFSAQTVFQNSNLANEVILLAPFPNAQATVAFNLPNGINTEPILAEKMAGTELENVLNEHGTNFGAWQVLLPQLVTAIAGQVTVQFTLYLGNATLGMQPLYLNVEKGVPIELPPEPLANIYEQILQEISNLTAQIDTGSLTLIKVNALPTENISTNAIYELTQDINGVVYTYYFIYSGIWQQLNASYIESANVNANFPNGVYFSQGETYVVNNGTVYRLLNNADYLALNASIQELAQLAQNTENKASSAETTANTALQTANTANEKATTADTKATSADTKATNALSSASTANTKATQAEATANEALQKANASATALRFMGNLTTIASLPAPSATTLGEVYNITDAFTTTSSFLLGAGREYPAGTNVAIVQKQTGATVEYYYDALSGLVDLSGYQTKIVGEVTIDVSQITSSETATEFSLTDEQLAVFQNCDVVVVNAEALGLGINNFYKQTVANVEDVAFCMFSNITNTHSTVIGTSLRIDLNTKIATMLYVNLEQRDLISFVPFQSNSQISDTVEVSGLTVSLKDYRIPLTNRTFSGKYLTVDSSGSVVWGDLPLYNGETE